MNSQKKFKLWLEFCAVSFWLDDGKYIRNENCP